MADNYLKEHNKPTYKKMCAKFDAGVKKVGVVQATGTGKSYLAFQWLYDNVLIQEGKTAIVLEPLYGILSQFEKKLKRAEREKGLRYDNVHLMHYSKLARKMQAMSEEDLALLKFDYIVLDEFHGLGAAQRGEAVRKLLELNPNAKVLGLTATPIRYLDNNRDMGAEIFGKDIVYGINLVEAIKKGVLPSPNYVIATYSYGDIVENLEEKIKQIKNVKERNELKAKLQQIKSKITEAEELDSLFGRKIEKKDGKFIAFCPSIKELNNLIERIKGGLFKFVNDDVKIYKVTHNDGKDENMKVIRDFEQDTSGALKIMLAVDMFNEGIHVKGIDGCFMFRPTNSPRLYLQQLGRVLSVRDDKDFHPIVFDVVNNINCLSNIDAAIQLATGGAIHGGEGVDTKFEDVLFSIDGNNMELNELLSQLSETITRHITSTEDYLASAKAYNDEFGNLDVPTRYVDPAGIPLGSFMKNIQKVYREENPTPDDSDDLSDIDDKGDTIFE